jgi:hypothetical protein
MKIENCAENIITDVSLSEYKKYHHYVGFYSKYMLPSIENNVVIINNKEYTVITENKILNFSYDGTDVIIEEQNFIYSDERLEYGEYIFDSNKKNIVGVITNIYSGKYYPIPNAFNNNNSHKSKINTLQIKSKIFPICYADKEFVNKEDLKLYIDSNPEFHGLNMIIYKVTGNTETQILTYGTEFSITDRFRCPCIDEYRSAAIDKIKFE